MAAPQKVVYGGMGLVMFIGTLILGVLFLAGGVFGANPLLLILGIGIIAGGIYLTYRVGKAGVSQTDR